MCDAISFVKTILMYESSFFFLIINVYLITQQLISRYVKLKLQNEGRASSAVAESDEGEKKNSLTTTSVYIARMSTISKSVNA